jgi:hypothetical protein
MQSVLDTHHQSENSLLPTPICNSKEKYMRRGERECNVLAFFGVIKQTLFLPLPLSNPLTDVDH